MRSRGQDPRMHVYSYTHACLFIHACYRSKTDFIILSYTHALRVRVWDPRKHHFSLKDKFMCACMRPPEAYQKMRKNYIYRLQRLFRHACMLIWTRIHKRLRVQYYRRMESVLLLLAPSLNDHSKLKGQCTDFKSGCVTSAWPIVPTFSVKNKNLVLLSL